jgi:hypothetical protein
MTPSCAPGHANVRFAPRSREFIAMCAPPKLLRSVTVTRGTVASAKAYTSLAPWRMTPARSCAVPGM